MIKLNFLFIVMDLLTLMVYPVLFVYGKLCRSVKTKEEILLSNALAVVLIAPEK